VLFDEAVKIAPLGDGHFLVTGNDKEIRVDLEDGDLLVMHDPQKGDLTFERLR
jgi:hypothetical protein